MGRGVLVADDHAAVRSAVRADLEELGYRVCAEAGDADGAVSAAVRERPDVCLLDVRMPGGGIEAARRIHERLPDVPIVMLSVSLDAADVRASAEAGACAYVGKDAPVEQLAAALEAALAGSDR